MNVTAKIGKGRTGCPHDCPSTCALEIDLLDAQTIGRVHGDKSHPYTDGVVCAKVARYAERQHHPDRLMQPLRRKGDKGSGQWQSIDWDSALDEIAEAFLKAEQMYGPEAVWPYYYAGTMGHLMRDGINRLTHVKKYSRMHKSICSIVAQSGFIAGAGKLLGPDALEMQSSDVIVLWGCNAVHTQVNLMSHIAKARKNRGTKLVVIDIYDNATMKQADIKVCLKPGTDAALACAIMHVLYRDGYADWDYMNDYADDPSGFETHLKSRTPAWAADITGLDVDLIEELAALIGQNKRSYFRLGFGFTRQHNGAVSMHAASCIPIVSGAWAHEGGGAMHAMNGAYHLNKSLIEGMDEFDHSTRIIDMAHIGRALTGDAIALSGGVPVTAMVMQNTNPLAIAPEQDLVKQGFARSDLFVAVHEQFMTETAQMADIVLPATMFTEHDDIYTAGAHPSIIAGSRLLDAPGACRSNHDLICGIAHRVGASHQGFEMSVAEHLDHCLAGGSYGNYQDLREKGWFDVTPSFEETHYTEGFAHGDGRFHLKADWQVLNGRAEAGLVGPHEEMPTFPDYWAVNEDTTPEHPFKLATCPARHFLNSSFNETPTSLDKEKGPYVFIHPDDAAAYKIEDEAWVQVANERGQVKVQAKIFPGLSEGVLIIESVFPNESHSDHKGVNTLTSAEQTAPFGGTAFHDNHARITLL